MKSKKAKKKKSLYHDEGYGTYDENGNYIKVDRFAYYGLRDSKHSLGHLMIPFCRNEEQILQDKELAASLIVKGKPIPEDLAQRLLAYKADYEAYRKMMEIPEEEYERYGIRKRTPEEINAHIRKMDYARSLGIKVDLFDGEPEAPHVEKDRGMAMSYIMLNKKVPQDLVERLLRYKAEDEKNEKTGKK